MAGMLGHDELERRLGFHPGTPATAPLYELNRELVLSVADAWDQALPAGREAALAQTALQEALMWANAAVATNLAPLGPERGAQHPAAAVKREPVDARTLGRLADVQLPPCDCKAAHVPGLEHAMSCPARVAALEVTDRGRC